MSNNATKVFVIGIDGATLDLIRPWVKSGDLPNIEKFMGEGSHGVLNSTIHPLTAPAWTSFMTGKNPGKHGIFDFIIKVPGSYDIMLVDSKVRDPNTLWQILSKNDKKVGVINIPLNYPPEKVNGFLVSWMDAPGTNVPFTYPDELYKELKNNIGEYHITVDFNQALDEYRDSLFELVENRARAAEYLMTSKEWDFFTVLFSATDFAQHAYWKFMDKDHPLYRQDEAEKYGDVIKNIYKKVDEKIGHLQGLLDDDTVVMLVSDHGAGPLKGVVNLNRWLESHGLLKFKASKTQFYKNIVRGFYQYLKGALPKKLKNILKSKTSNFRSRVESMLFAALINWDETQAFSVGAYGNIWINLKGRETSGIVDADEFDKLRNTIIKKLDDLVNDQGEKIVECVYKKEDIYSGEYIDRAPDLIIRWKDYAYHSRQRFGEDEKEIFQSVQTMPLSKLEMNGFHKMEGVVFVKGPGIKKNNVIKDANIIDMAPTILYVMGLDIPSDMDGQIVKDIFEEDYLSSHSASFHETDSEKKEDLDSVYSQDEADKVADRLKNLGYM